MKWIPGWLIALIIIALVVWVANALGIIHIHFNVGGSVSF